MLGLGRKPYQETIAGAFRGVSMLNISAAPRRMDWSFALLMIGFVCFDSNIKADTSCSWPIRSSSRFAAISSLSPPVSLPLPFGFADLG